tara:strand:+ start:810 stop:1001 length:192 start_codon:yes stop_codon:yes gene_type:complete
MRPVDFKDDFYDRDPLSSNNDLYDVVVPKGTLFCGECGNKRELIVETDINSDRVCKSRLCKAK